MSPVARSHSLLRICTEMIACVHLLLFLCSYDSDDLLHIFMGGNFCIYIHIHIQYI